ncbi:hypothetical protein [Clostridium sp. 'White wine YQ']|uniref:hypothetical protein n=1 Tax=Clostridium sp. 'White wine YQ' TaxID=3027474 RepID=UPI0023654B16|nr:hypothetical protein [Clostridium sp. 'White wine YQ']MDD7795703.1 hypothetical protein [Clostridium sp. 'White wine YQ']
MIKNYLIELIVTCIPQMFLMAITIYMIANKIFDKKKILISTAIMGPVGLVVPKLPISFGIHTIIIMCIYIFVLIVINKIEVRKAVSGILICLFIIIISEFINFAILGSFGITPDKKEFITQFYMMPATLIYILINFAIYKLFYLKRKSVQA